MNERSCFAEFTPFSMAFDSAASILRRISADVSATGREPRVPQKRTRMLCDLCREGFQGRR